MPAIGEEFYGNFYAREDAQVDFNNDTQKINRDGKDLLERVRDLGRAVTDDDDYEKLQQAGELASTAITANTYDNDAEELKHIEEDLQSAKKILADIRERNRDNIRREEFGYLRRRYEKLVKNFAEPQEIEQIEKLLARAETLIERDDSAFTDTAGEIYGWFWKILFYRSNEYAVSSFNNAIKDPGEYDDPISFRRLAQAGKNAVAQKDFAELRKIIFRLWDLSGRREDERLTANIIKA